MNRHFIALLVILIVVGALPLAAQTSSIQGVVTDAQGAVVPAAIVTITNTDTSLVRRELTDENGAYKILQMIPGPYKIEIQKPGFKTKTATLAFQVDVPETLNVQLDVGQTVDTVNVTAEATQVNTQNATTGNPFNEEQVQNLPLQTRNVVALLSIQPGVTAGGNVIGSRTNQTYVTLDGANVNGFTGTGGFTSALPIPLDSVQEFRTTTNGQGADGGRGSGGTASIITKSGSNAFHGSVYEFNRNTDFEANDFFNNRAGTPRPALIRNQYGASIGGPIRKNKLFFFYNFEGRKDRSQSTKTDQVPSPSLREGIVKVQLKGSNQIVQLSPQDVKNIDPLGMGENPYMFQLFQQYPQGNDPIDGTDKGLNFYALRFNAPQPLNNHVQVGKLDYNLDNAGKHTISIRGTLNGASQVATAAQFPGQPPASLSQDDSKGLSARYTYVVSPSIVNAFNFGYSRGGSASTGNLNIVPSFPFTSLGATPRGSQAFQPVYSYNDDLTWNKGRHTYQFGFVWHQAESISNSLGNEPGYSFSSSTLLQLGGDITGDVTSYIQKTIPGASLFSTSNVISTFGAAFGMLNAGSATYNYLLNGQSIPFGTPITRDFKTWSPEGYAQDSWKVLPNLTVTYGLRYSIYGAPYEANGVQVQPTVSANQYFAERQAAATYGVPNYSLKDAYLTYLPSGPVNHGPNYYPVSFTNFAPRLGFAYSPKGALETILGKGSVIRGSYNLVYDNYGNDMASNFASSGTPGLTNSVNQSVNTNFTTAPRYNGTNTTYPALQPAPAGITFPYTPPLAQGGFVRFYAVSQDLKAPYEHLISFNYARPLPKHMTIEVGYAGRLSHRAIQTADWGQALSQFTDSKSGQTWQQAAMVIANLYYTGLTPAQVKANPNLVPQQPFIQDLFPGAANFFIPGSATANLFYGAYQSYSGSWLDTLNAMDRIHEPGGGSANGGCISIYGCNTFFTTQFSDLLTYANDAHAAYNGMLATLRRTVSHGWGYDFNYTWSHAIDNGVGGTLQNAFQPDQGLGPASFDMRHVITADFVVDVPLGKGKALFPNMPKWADAIVGGWQTTGLYSFHTGTPLNCSSSNQYNVNYLNSSLCILYPGVTKPPSRSVTVDQLGMINEYANTSAGNDFVPGYAGIAGYNGMGRGLSFWNFDAAVNKNFAVWKERVKATVRIEAYNVLNKQEFSSSTMSISALQPGTNSLGQPSEFGNSRFGEINSSASTPRVLQAVLRFSF